MKKANKEISEKRVFQISELLLDCVSNYEIVQGCTNEWNIGWRQVYKYIAVARQKIEKTYQKEFQQNLSWHMVARKKLVRKLLNKKDEKGAAQVLRDMAELQGYYKQLHEITGKDGEPIKFIDVTDGEE